MLPCPFWSVVTGWTGQLKTEKAQVPPSELVIGWLLSFMVLISTLLRSPPRKRRSKNETDGKKTNDSEFQRSVHGEETSSFVFRWEGKADWWRKRCRGSPLPNSLAGLVDLRFDVLDGGVFGDTRLGLLVSHLSSCRGEVLITLNKTKPVRCWRRKEKMKNEPVSSFRRDDTSGWTQTAVTAPWW